MQLILPRFFNLTIHLDGADVIWEAEAFQPEVIREAEPLGAEGRIFNTEMGSNCWLPRTPMMSTVPMRATLPDGREGTLFPRRPDGKRGFYGVLAVDQDT